MDNFSTMFFMVIGLGVCAVSAMKLIVLTALEAYKQVHIKALEATREVLKAEALTHNEGTK